MRPPRDPHMYERATLNAAHEAVQSAARSWAIIGEALKASADAVKAAAESLRESRSEANAIGFERFQDAEK